MADKNVLSYILYYGGNPYYPCDQFVVDNCQAAVASDPPILDRLKALKPGFPCDTYESATDSYQLDANGNLHPEEVLLRALCNTLAIDIEECFLHYADDTVIDWDYTGKSPDLVSYAAGARIEKYRGAHQSGGQKRVATHFSPTASPALTARVVERATRSTAGGNHWEGIFLDNCGPAFYSFGVRVISGGHVAEANGLALDARATSPFGQWQWNLQRAWLAATKAALHAQSRTLTINVANGWTDDYVTYGCADRIYMEFVGQLTRDASLFTIASHIHRHRLCADAGIWLSMAPPLQYGGQPPETDLEIAYGALCLHLVAGAEYSTTWMQDLTWPYRPDWPQRIQSPATIPVNASHGPRLGPPVGDAYIRAEGVNEYGHHYQVWVRPYRNGEVMARMMEPGYPAPSTLETWTWPRPPVARLLSPDGTLAPTSMQPALIEIKNGGGAILIVG